ncbi:unnamed protein product [Somion occarium]|uniref:peptidylprolyl isomerase n=1 Tax=Somion occarium TaxID=3059160 RepID=A0ABP1DN01_9APHY
MSAGTKAYLDIYIGDQEKHNREQTAYDATHILLTKNASIYGLPSSPELLSEEQQDILKELDSSLEMRFQPPEPLRAGRLVFKLDDSPGLVETRANFIALCTGEKGACKNAPNKRLHYLNTPVHRIVKGFVAQGGDITRGDGSGGSLAMANSGKNSNSSQFFIVLANDETKLSKMNGKYVAFGEAVEGWDVLDKLDEVGGDADGKPTSSVWIGDCGKC